MELIADVLLVAGAFGAALYCHVLSRRLKRLGTLEGGMGGAIAVLSAQVDDMTRALSDAQKAARLSATQLDQLTRRAEASAQKLELMIASLHDLPEPARPVQDPPPVAPSSARVDAPVPPHAAAPAPVAAQHAQDGGAEDAPEGRGAAMPQGGQDHAAAQPQQVRAAPSESAQPDAKPESPAVASPTATPAEPDEAAVHVPDESDVRPSGRKLVLERRRRTNRVAKVLT